LEEEIGCEIIVDCCKVAEECIEEGFEVSAN
jgi:hypothetical protein